MMQTGFKPYCLHLTLNKKLFCNIEFYLRENFHCLHCPSTKYPISLYYFAQKKWTLPIKWCGKSVNVRWSIENIFLVNFICFSASINVLIRHLIYTISIFSRKVTLELVFAIKTEDNFTRLKRESKTKPGKEAKGTIIQCYAMNSGIVHFSGQDKFTSCRPRKV